MLLPKPIYKERAAAVTNYHIYNQYIVRVEKRDKLRRYLAAKEISTEIYYPVPFHKQECFSYLGYKPGDFPMAEQAADTSIALPIYPELTVEQLTYVVDTIKEFVANE